MVKTSTLIVILGVMILSIGVFATDAEGAGLVWRAINKAGSILNDIGSPTSSYSFNNQRITSLGTPTASTDASRANTLQIGKVLAVGTCADGSPLEYQTSNSTWICGTDTGLTAAVTSINSDTTAAQVFSGTAGNVTITDTGAGTLQWNTGYNVVVTGGSAQTVTKGLTLNALTLGGQMNLGGNTMLNTGTLTFPTTTTTLAGLAVAEKFTANQTLQNPQINGLDINYTAFAADHTADYTEDVIDIDTTSATRTVTLPTAVGHTGKIYFIKMTGLSAGNVVIINPTGAETIDGGANKNLTHSDEAVAVQSDGSNWITISQDPNEMNAWKKRGSTTQWYGTAVTQATTNTLTSVVSTLRASPWIVPNTIQIDKIQVEISSAANPTSTTCRIGIYRDSGNVYPQALVSGSDVGTFTTTAGVKTNTFGSPITLNKGLYWLAWTCGTAATTQPSFRALTPPAVPNVLGYVNTMGANGGGTAYTVAFTYAAMPAQYPAGATILANTNVPIILVEVNKG